MLILIFALEAILVEPRRQVKHIRIIGQLVELRQVDILVTVPLRSRVKVVVAEVSPAGSQAQFNFRASVF